jgi:hypothetical protein
VEISPTSAVAPGSFLSDNRRNVEGDGHRLSFIEVDRGVVHRSPQVAEELLDPDLPRPDKYPLEKGNSSPHPFAVEVDVVGQG